MECDNFIKGVCLEITDKSKFKSKEELEKLKDELSKITNEEEYNNKLNEYIIGEMNYESCKNNGLFLDDLVKRDDIFQTYKDAGVTHFFLQAIIKIDKNNPNSITIQNFCSYDCDNSQE